MFKQYFYTDSDQYETSEDFNAQVEAFPEKYSDQTSGQRNYE